METFLFLSPFALFFFIFPLAYFQLNTLAIVITLVLIGWFMIVPILALLVREKKEKNGN